MKAYSVFASIYDKMMDNIPYEDWKEYLLLLMYKYRVKPMSSVTEIGCGTGTMTGLLAEDGFNVTGLDLSKDMLREAKKKYPTLEFREADMRDFILPDKQDAIISICDSVNYLLTVDDLTRTFSSVRKNLKDGGVFIFDLKTRYFFENVLDGRTFKDRSSDYRCIWKNHYDENANIHNYLLDINVRDDNGWIHTEERHRQRAYNAKEIVAAAMAAGFEKGRAFDAFSFDKPKKKSERIYVVLKKQKTVKIK